MDSVFWLLALSNAKYNIFRGLSQYRTLRCEKTSLSQPNPRVTWCDRLKHLSMDYRLYTLPISIYPYQTYEARSNIVYEPNAVKINYFHGAILVKVACRVSAVASKPPFAFILVVLSGSTAGFL